MYFFWKVPTTLSWNLSPSEVSIQRSLKLLLKNLDIDVLDTFHLPSQKVTGQTQKYLPFYLAVKKDRKAFYRTSFGSLLKEKPTSLLLKCVPPHTIFRTHLLLFPMKYIYNAPSIYSKNLENHTFCLHNNKNEYCDTWSLFFLKKKNHSSTILPYFGNASPVLSSFHKLGTCKGNSCMASVRFHKLLFAH